MEHFLVRRLAGQDAKSKFLSIVPRSNPSSSEELLGRRKRNLRGAEDNIPCLFCVFCLLLKLWQAKVLLQFALISALWNSKHKVPVCHLAEKRWPHWRCSWPVSCARLPNSKSHLTLVVWFAVDASKMSIFCLPNEPYRVHWSCQYQTTLWQLQYQLWSLPSTKRHCLSCFQLSWSCCTKTMYQNVEVNAIILKTIQTAKISILKSGRCFVLAKKR